MIRRFKTFYPSLEDRLTKHSIYPHSDFFYYQRLFFMFYDRLLAEPIVRGHWFSNCLYFDEGRGKPADWMPIEGMLLGVACSKQAKDNFRNYYRYVCVTEYEATKPRNPPDLSKTAKPEENNGNSA